MRPDRLHNGGPPVDDDAEGNTYNVHRQTHEHWLVGAGQPVDPADPSRGAYSRFEAWTDFIRTARWKPVTINFYGQHVTLERGELVGGYPVLAQRWNWTYKRVRLFVEKLLDEGMIGISPTVYGHHETRNQQQSVKSLNQDTPQGRQQGNRALILRLCNYDKYQYDVDDVGQATGQATGQARGRRGAGEGQQIERRMKEEKEIGYAGANQPTLSEASASDYDDDLFDLTVAPAEKRSRRNAKAYTDEFEAFWSGYPDKRNNSKSQAFAEWGRLDAVSRQQATASLPAFTAFLRSRPDHPVIHAERYLKHRRFEGYASPAVAHAEPTRVGPNGKTWGWWRGSEDKARLLSADDWRKMLASNRPNGEWPWWNLGAPPGHAECLLPAEVLSEGGWVEKYHGRVMARADTETGSARANGGQGVSS